MEKLQEMEEKAEELRRIGKALTEDERRLYKEEENFQAEIANQVAKQEIKNDQRILKTLKKRGPDSKVFYDGLAKNLDIACEAANVENSELDRINYAT